MTAVRVLRGRPDDTEVAAVVAVVLGLAGARPGPAARPRRAWSDPARALRTALPPARRS